ncbi:MAG: hypothetical protein AB1646_00810 [Thermodesulfobacteriota bacterium]
MHGNHPDEWMSLDEELAEFLGDDPPRHAKFDEAGRKIEVARYVPDLRMDLCLTPERSGEIIGCSAAVLVVNPEYLMEMVDRSKLFLFSKDDAASRWLAVGVQAYANGQGLYWASSRKAASRKGPGGMMGKELEQTTSAAGAEVSDSSGRR